MIKFLARARPEPPWSPRHRVVAAVAAVAAATLTATGMPIVGRATAATAPVARAAGVGCDATSLTAMLGLRGVTVARAERVSSGTYSPPGIPPITGLPAMCALGVTDLDPSGNVMNEEFWLPLSWNGRFQGVGGGGYSCGISWPALAAAVKAGYAAGSTDCGHTGGDGSFALRSDGSRNTPLIEDFASRGIHDMSVAGKALTATYYAKRPAYSYFNGCSTGGRQGLMEAQRFPGDYDGILSGAPAINWTRFIPAEIWPQLVMKESGDFLPTCKQQAFTEAVIASCDRNDGVTDGVIDDPLRCRWSPSALIGTGTACGTITAADAAVVAEIWRGPVSRSGRKLWYGLTPGTSLAGLARTTTGNGGTTPQPFPISVTWLGTWVQQDPAWDWTTLTYAQFDRLFRQSVKQFSRVIATDDPDLSAFERRGGKVLIWHGLTDELIFPQGTINYYERVQQTIGSAARTADFARLFLAPGARHCGSGAGPAPSDPLTALVAWVERGKAPATLAANVTDPATGAVTRSRIICPYPAQAKYIRAGSPDDARNFVCVRSGRR
jgi:hypothetical protein